MIVFYLTAVGVILAYLMLTIKKFNKIPVSISDTYYMWKSVGYSWLFTATMWITGLAILIYWITEASLYKCQFLAFLSISGMLFVGGACMFKETLTRGVHFTSASIWAASALLFFIVNKLYDPILVGLVFGIVGWILNKCKNLTFWAEIACVVMMIIGIGIL
jgi:hypothetical protein